MFSKSLFKQSFKANWKIWMVVTVIMCMLVAQFCAMESSIMDLTTVIYYGLMTTMIPVIYIVICSNSLLAKQVDDGSMAYVLSTPVKRSQVAITQAIFSACSVFVTFLSVTFVHMIVKLVMGSDSLSYAQVVYLNLGAFAIDVALAGVCYMFSGIFNRSKHALGAGGGLCVFFILMSMMALFGGLSSEMAILENFQYVTLTTLYDTGSIIAGTSAWIWKVCVLLLVAIGAYAFGAAKFCKKDLPL